MEDGRERTEPQPRARMEGFDAPDPPPIPPHRAHAVAAAATGLRATHGRGAPPRSQTR